MNAGYLSLWVVFSVFILIVTGWKPIIAPGVNRRTMMLFVVFGAALLPFSLWWTPISQLPALQVHAAIGVLLVFGAAALLTGDGEWSYKGYLVLSMLMIAAIWGMARKMYSYDPVFYVLDPMWDAPLLGGFLCGAFTSSTKQQFGILAWGAVLGEVLYAIMDSGAYLVSIGSFAWWDSFWIAAVAAFGFSMLAKALRVLLQKLGGLLPNMKDGQGS